MGRKIFQSDPTFCAEQHRPFDGMLQFPDVTRPAVVHKRGESVLLDAIQLALGLAGKFLHEVLNQAGNILRSLPQGRQIDANDV